MNEMLVYYRGIEGVTRAPNEAQLQALLDPALRQCYALLREELVAQTTYPHQHDMYFGLMMSIAATRVAIQIHEERTGEV